MSYKCSDCNRWIWELGDTPNGEAECDCYSPLRNCISKLERDLATAQAKQNRELLKQGENYKIAMEQAIGRCQDFITANKALTIENIELRKQLEQYVSEVDVLRHRLRQCWSLVPDGTEHQMIPYIKQMIFQRGVSLGNEQARNVKES